MPNFIASGTVNVTAGQTLVTFEGVLLTEARAGDTLELYGANKGRYTLASIGTDLDSAQLSVPFDGVTAPGAAYTIRYDSLQRVPPLELADQLRRMRDQIRIFERTAPVYRVQSININTPPGAPVTGDIYVIGGAPTNAWAGYAYNLAQWTGTGWLLTAPEAGWWAYSETDGLFVFTGSVWSPGEFGFRPKGAWSSGTTYMVGDMVSHSGRSFVSFVNDNLNNAPPTSASSSAHWMWLPSNPANSATNLSDYDDAPYESGMLLPVICSPAGGGPSLRLGGWDKMGYFRSTIHADDFNASEWGAQIPALTLIALGARGTIHKARKMGDFYRFLSDSMGTTLPFKAKVSTFTDLAKVVDGHPGVSAYFGYGQSWRTISYSTLGEVVSGYNVEPEAACTLHVTTSGGARSVLGPTIGVTYPGDSVLDDICGLTASIPACIDNVAAIARARWRRLRTMRQQTDFHVCFGYPASGWDWGGDSGTGLNEASLSWGRGVQALNRLRALLTTYGFSVVRVPISWTQGGDPAKDLAGNIDDLAQLRTQWGVSAAGGPAQPLFIGVVPGGSSEVEMPIGAKAQIQYCRDNVGNGVYLTYPWYMLRLTSTGGGDPGNIHFDVTGIVRYAAVEGYIQVAVEAGVVWTPFWLTRGANPVTVSGQEITVTFDAPAGGDFTGRVPRRVTSADEPDLPEAALYDGFRVKRGGSFLTLSPPIYSLNASGKPQMKTMVTEPLSSGNVLEVSYCAYGPGSVPYGHSGVWGNVILRGPRCPVRRDVPEPYVDMPLVPFIQSVTV